MRILLDNCVDRKFAANLVDHEVEHCRTRGWRDLSNGVLLQAAEDEGFDVLLTVDKNLRYQQSLRGRKISVVILNSRFVAYDDIVPLVPKLLAELRKLQRGSFLVIDP